MSDDIVQRLRNGAQSRVGSLSGKALKQRMPTVNLLLGAADEIERLRAWRREATEVLGNWELVAEMVTPRPQDLGRSKADMVADEIERLRAERTYEARAATVEHCDDPWTCCIHTPEMRDEVPR